MPETKAYLSKIKLPSGSVYYLKDSEAQDKIAALEKVASSGVSYGGTTTTALEDGATTSPIVVNDSSAEGGTKEIAPVTGMMVNYDNVMFAWNGSQWDQLGAADKYGELAYADAVVGKVTPTATITMPETSFTGDEATIAVTVPTVESVTVTSKTAGEGDTPNYTPIGEVSAPKFTGHEGDVSVAGTPLGDVTIAVGDGAANYTPAGELKDLKTEVTVNDTTVNSITDVGTLPSWNATVTDETLSFDWSEGTLPTKGEDTTVATGINTATTTGSFEGAGVNLAATFAGKSTTSTGKFTPDGENAAPGFTGKGAVITAATTAGTQEVSTKYTPTGKAAAPDVEFDELTIESTAKKNA